MDIIILCGLTTFRTVYRKVIGILKEDNLLSLIDKAYPTPHLWSQKANASVNDKYNNVAKSLKKDCTKCHYALRLVAGRCREGTFYERSKCSI